MRLCHRHIDSADSGAASENRAWLMLQTGFTVAVALAFTGCMSTVRIEDENRGVRFVASVPAWPWQNSMRLLDKMNLSARGTNFTASLRGLTETETTDTNTVRMIESIVGAAVGSAIRAAVMKP